MLRSTGIYIGLAAVLGFVAPTAFAETASPGCGRADWGSGSFTMLHEEILRTFRVHVPGALRNDHPAPLVMMFHGWGGNEDEFIGSEVIRSEADERGYILVAPRGLGSGEPDQAFNSWTFSGSASGLDGDGFNPGVAGDSKAICDATLDQGITPDYRYPSCKDQDVAQNSCSWTQCQQDDVEFVIALVAEVVFHLLPLGILVLVFREGPAPSWVIGPVILIEPLFQAVFVEGPAVQSILVVLDVALVSAAQLLLYRRYGFAAMIGLRWSFYLFWHILWGQARLALLF